MKFGKLILWGGLGYLGYKVLSGGTFMPGDTTAVDLFTKAQKVLDPSKKWTLTVASNTGAVNIASADGTVSQVFVNSAAAQSWLNTMVPHGQYVDVTYQRI